MTRAGRAPLGAPCGVGAVPAGGLVGALQVTQFRLTLGWCLLALVGVGSDVGVDWRGALFSSGRLWVITINFFTMNWHPPFPPIRYATCNPVLSFRLIAD